MTNQAPEQLYVEFDVNSPESLRTINFEGESQTKKSNEYNISVFNADGSPALGRIQGIVTLDAYSPGADRPITTANTVDLSSGCRKFDLFFATIERVVFSVSGLIPGQTIRISAFRGKGVVLAGSGSGLNTLDPVNLREWTPNFSGAGFISIPDWRPSGDYRIEVSIYIREHKDFNTIFDNSNEPNDSESWVGSSGALTWRPRLTNRLNISSIPENAIIDIVESRVGNEYRLEAIGRNFTMPVGLNTDQGDLINGIGGINTGNTKLNGQIRNLRLTDLDNPSNSRFYPLTLEATTRPTTTTAVDELGPLQIVDITRFKESDFTGNNIISNGVLTLTIANTSIMSNDTYPFIMGETYRVTPVGLSGDIQIGANNVVSFVSLQEQGITFRSLSTTSMSILFRTTNTGSIEGLIIELLTDGTLTSFPANMIWTEVETGAPVVQMDLRNDLSVFPSSAGSATFARNGIGTFTRDGQLMEAAVNVARFEDEGVLIEGEARNLLARSNEFEDIYWSKNPGSSVSNNSQPSPDGGNNARTLTTNGTAVLFRPSLGRATGTFSLSIYAKARTSQILRLRLDSPGTQADFNLVTGEIVTTSPMATSGITRLNDGWFRCWVTVNVTNLVNAVIGTVTQGSIDIFGANLSELDFTPSYIPTTTAPVTRPADALTVPFPISGTQDFTLFIVARFNGFDRTDPRLFQGGGIEWLLFDTGNIFVSIASTLYQLEAPAERPNPLELNVYALTRDGIFSNGVRLLSFQKNTGSLTAGLINIGDRNARDRTTFGNFRNYTVYDRTLPDSEIATLSQQLLR